jgi:hypothetical protein
MGIMEHKIEGNRAEREIAEIMKRPWYRRIENWLTLANIVALIINIVLTAKLL